MPFSHLLGDASLLAPDLGQDGQQLQSPGQGPSEPSSVLTNSSHPSRPPAVRSYSSGWSGNGGVPSLSRGSSYGPASSASVSSTSVDTPFQSGLEGPSGFSPSTAYPSPSSSTHVLPSHSSYHSSRHVNPRYSPISAEGRYPGNQYGLGSHHSAMASGVTAAADSRYTYDTHPDGSRKHIPSMLQSRLSVRGVGKGPSDAVLSSSHPGPGPWLREPAYSVHSDSLGTSMHSAPHSQSEASPSVTRSDLPPSATEMSSRVRLDQYNASRQFNSESGRPDLSSSTSSAGYGGALPFGAPSSLYPDASGRPPQDYYSGDTSASHGDPRHIARRGSGQLCFSSSEPVSTSHLSSSAAAAAAAAAGRSPAWRDSHTLASPAFSSFSIGDTAAAQGRDISVFQPYPGSTGTSLPTPTTWYSNSSAATGNSVGSTPADRERMWHSIQTRSRAADRSFLFGRVSSRVFCRPSCPLDTPLAHDVAFFAFPDARKIADSEGYRPCRRCKPQREAKNEKALTSVCEAARGLDREARGVENPEYLPEQPPAVKTSQSPESGEGTTSSKVAGPAGEDGEEGSSSRGVKRSSHDMDAGSEDEDNNSPSPVEDAEASTAAKKKGKTTRTSSKRTTFKSQAARVGMSTFHLHRTFLAVTAITPGEFSKVCQVLALQELLAIDARQIQARRTGMPLAPPISQATDLPLPGWTARRAQRALGNMSLQNYGRGGTPSIQIRILSASGTSYGCVTFAWVDSTGEATQASAGSAHSQGGAVTVTPADVEAFEQLSDSSSVQMDSRGLLCGLLIGNDSLERMKIRFPRATVETRADRVLWLKMVVQRLYSTSLREDQMDDDVIHLVRRARVWVKLRDWIERGSGQDVLAKRNVRQEGETFTTLPSGYQTFAPDSPEDTKPILHPAYQTSQSQHASFSQDEFADRNRAGGPPEQLPSMGHSFSTRPALSFTAQSSYAYQDQRSSPVTPLTPQSYPSSFGDGRQQYSGPPHNHQHQEHGQQDSIFR